MFCFTGEKNDEWMRSTAIVMAPLCTMAVGERRKGVFEKNQIQPLQSGRPKLIPDNIPLLWFHDKPAGVGGGGG